MDLKSYANRKFGNKKSLTGGLIYMLKASFLSNTFKGFWQQWNPLWSYFLTFYVYRTSRKVIPNSLAILFTFAVSGFLHDVFVMVLLQKPYYLFTLIFFTFGLIVCVESVIKISLNKFPKSLKPIYHLTLIIGTVLLIEHQYHG